MNTLDIIKRSLERDGYHGQEQTKMLAALHLALNTGSTKLVQLGQSVFMVTVIGPGQVEVHVFSEEQGPGIVDNVKKLVNYLKGIGVKKAKTMTNDPRFQAVAKATGLPVQARQTTEMQGNQMVPTYEYSLDL